MFGPAPQVEFSEIRLSLNIAFWYIASAIAVWLVPPRPMLFALMRAPLFLLGTIFYVAVGTKMNAGAAFGTIGIFVGLLFGMSVSKYEKGAA